MTQSDQLLEFIDGNLQGADEQALFDSLAAEPELRTELRDFVQIGQAVRADREAFSPPADVERRLLGGLGLLPIGAVSGGAAATGGFLSGLLTKGGFLPVLFGTLLGGLIATGGFLLADGSGGAENDLPAATAISDGVDHESGTTGHLASAGGTGVTHGVVEHRRGGEASMFATARERRAERISERISERRVEKNAQLADRRERRANNAPRANNRPDEHPPQFRNEQTRLQGEMKEVREENQKLRAEIALLKTSALNNNSQIHVAKQTAKQNDDRLSPATAKTESLGIKNPRANDDLRASRSPSSLPAITPARFPEMEPTESGKYLGFEARSLLLNRPIVDNDARQVDADLARENFVLGGYYGDATGWQVGLEAGRERYTQSFFYNREDSLVIEQRPIVGWGGLAARLETELFTLPITVGGTLGASQYGGPVMRGLVGADLLGLVTGGTSKAGPLRLPLAVEASSLVYTFNDQYFVSGNWGLNFGLQYRVGL